MEEGKTYKWEQMYGPIRFNAGYLWDGEFPDKQASDEEKASFRTVFRCDEGVARHTDQFLAHPFSSGTVTRLDVKGLRPEGWVTDQVINRSIELIQV